MFSRNDKLYIKDIVDSVTAINQYIDKMDFDAFLLDRKTYAATIREFEIIGEAVGKISEDIKTKYGEIQWQDIKDFRNLLIHEYFGIDPEIIWNTIQNDLPNLLIVSIEILKSIEE